MRCWTGELCQKRQKNPGRNAGLSTSGCHFGTQPSPSGNHFEKSHSHVAILWCLRKQEQQSIKLMAASHNHRISPAPVRETRPQRIKNYDDNDKSTRRDGWVTKQYKNCCHLSVTRRALRHLCGWNLISTICSNPAKFLASFCSCPFAKNYTSSISQSHDQLQSQGIKVTLCRDNFKSEYHVCLCQTNCGGLKAPLGLRNAEILHKS